jgi:hypothetical protein
MPRKVPSDDNIEGLLEYLWNPISTGVYQIDVNVNLASLTDFARNILVITPHDSLERAKEDIPQLRRTLLKTANRDWTLNDIDDLDSILRIVPTLPIKMMEEIEEKVTPILNLFTYINGQGSFANLKKTFIPRFVNTRTTPSNASLARMAYNRAMRFDSVFASRVELNVPKEGTVLLNNKVNEYVIIRVISVNKAPIEKLKTLYAEAFGPSNTILNRIETKHASRKVMEPFLPAVKSWMKFDVERKITPKYLTDYVSAAIRYLADDQYLTSIVLANIALETLLAELWEENIHIEAPDIPLGALIEKFKERKPDFFLKQISDWIEKSNEARIKAVHRGGGNITAQEAMDSIRGLVMVALWYFHPEVI